MAHIRSLLDTHQTFALFCHQHADGDALGSLLALRNILIGQGKTVSCYTPDPPSQIFAFLDAIDQVQTEFDYGSYDCIIFLDFAVYHRISKFTLGHESYFDSAVTIAIDHHVCMTPPTMYWLIDETASSNCEWIYENFSPYYPIDAQTATYLYLGLTTDTGNLTHEQDSVRTLTNALKLVEAGADKTLIINNIFKSHTRGQIKFLELLIQRLQSQGVLARTWYTDQDLSEYQVDYEQAKLALGIVQSLADQALTLLFKQIDQHVGVSLRSKSINHQPAIDVNLLAQDFGGGGHRQAAGFRIVYSGDLPTQMRSIVNHMIEKVSHP